MVSISWEIVEIVDEKIHNRQEMFDLLLAKVDSLAEKIISNQNLPKKLKLLLFCVRYKFWSITAVLFHFYNYLELIWSKFTIFYNKYE